MRIILGSHSDRRKAILSAFNLPFIQAVSHFDEESVAFEGDPILYCTTLAMKKAEKLLLTFPHDLIIAADTTVYCNKQVFNKPSSKEEAKKMLAALAGREHHVYTGVCVGKKDSLRTGSALTKVWIAPLLDAQIEKFLSDDHYTDRAGAYSIQGRGSLIVEKILGCYYNVLGLPIGVLQELLKEHGIDLWENL